MKKYLLYILLLFFVLVGCNYQDDYNLVPTPDLPTSVYNVKLTAPLVNIDTMAYTIVEKGGKFFFTAFDRQGQIHFLSDVSDLFTGAFSLDNIKKLEYFALNNKFFVFMEIDNSIYPCKIASINPLDGQIIKLFDAHIAYDSNTLNTYFAAPYFSVETPKIFVIQEYTDTVGIYHKALITYDYINNSWASADTLSLDSLNTMDIGEDIWNQFIITDTITLFYLYEYKDNGNVVIAFKYNSLDDSVRFDTIPSHFLPISYVPVVSNFFFFTTLVDIRKVAFAMYDLNSYRYKLIFSQPIFENFIITNKISVLDTTYIIGYSTNVVPDNLNFADYNSIKGKYLLVRFNTQDLLSDPTNTLFIYTQLTDFKRFIPYGILDNGKGFTIIAKADAFEYFPAVMVIKTNYQGKPINAR